MLNLVENIYFFVLPTLVGMFGLHLLLRNSFAASKILGVYFLLFGFRIITSYFVTDGRLSQYPQLMNIQSPAHFLAGPIGFLFVYYMLYPYKNKQLWQWALFIPFALHLLELLPFYFGPLENKVYEVELILKNKSLISFPSKATYLSPFILAILKISYTSVLSIISFILVLKFIFQNSIKIARNRFVIIWLLSYTSLNLVSILFIVFYFIGLIGFNNLNFSYSDLLMHLAVFFNLGFVFYKPSLLDGFSFESSVLRLHEKDRHAELGEDKEKLKKYEVYAKKLESYFANDKPFLNPELTLDKAANKLQISTKELSRTTSYIYELGYPDFVNSWRINYIVEQRNSDKQWQSYSQDMLAELSGFGSRQALHNAINRLHGMSPAQFLKAKEDHSSLSN